MKAEIVTIGDELLIGQVVDTNSTWLATQLNQIGIAVNRIHSISDDAAEIKSILDDVKNRVNLLIFTGGLGPTKDDISKKAIAEYFNLELYENLQVLEQVRQFIHNRGFSMNELNRQQALVPENSRVMINRKGTAPGMWIEKDGFVCISLPGVPYEMKDIMVQDGLPALKKYFDTPFIVHRTILVHGISESQLAIKVEAWEDAIPKTIKLAYLPSPGRIRLRFSSVGKDKLAIETAIQEQISALEQLIPEHIVAYEDTNIEIVLSQVLREKGLKMATAESCTGGRIASKLTQLPGSSEWYAGSIIAYHNDLKTNLLQVPPTQIEEHGAVSSEVAKAMLLGLLDKPQVEVGLAVTGIAGPDGGTNEKPVGTVWIAVGNKKEQTIEHYQLGTQREQNIERASVIALTMLWNFVKQI